jgi:hypothetical protein
MAARKVNRFVPETFEGYKDCPYIHIKRVAEALMSTTTGLTTRQVCDVARVSETMAQTTMFDMRGLNFLYVSGWTLPEKGPRAAIFKVGNRPDKVKPWTRIPVEGVERKWHRVVRPPTEVEQAQTDYYTALAKALVPQRTAKKQREVNWQYLNWISGGVYA